MKEEYNAIVHNWQMTFQASDLKRKYFLDLLDNDYLSIMPTYMKDDAWLKLLGHSNFLCVKATRAITNHAPIEKYCLRFFPKENFNCLYRNYLIKSRYHILHECRRYNNY